MEARSLTHPSADSLRDYGLGKLDISSSDEIMRHLENCQDCQGKVAAVSGDDFVDRLRQARRPDSTPGPSQSSRETAHSMPDTCTPPPTPPPVVGLPPELAHHPQYEVVSELGRGGMGVVFLARNRLMARMVVLKVVNQELLDRSEGKERFLREIQSAAMLHHPNVVAAYSALEIGGLLVFAMEYVEGENLAKLVKARGPLPIVNACYYALQVAHGLQHAFEKKMVHRDIKPQNLILFRDGKKHVVKVLDFGLAKVLREKSADRELTGTGMMLGTPDYIAPEQTLDAAKADIRPTT
jgi:serine/threonine protein kinase